MKIVRRLKELGAELGLECLGLEDRSKHFKLMFRNKQGQTYGVTLHKTKDEPFRITAMNMEKQLRRFSEGKEMFK